MSCAAIDVWGGVVRRGGGGGEAPTIPCGMDCSFLVVIVTEGMGSYVPVGVDERAGVHSEGDMS
jgi:hypothetical protein